MATGLQLKHEFTPRGTAAEIFRRRDAEVLISGPAGTGKSRACLEKVHFMCLKNPGMRALIVRKTLASLASTGLETWRRYVVAESLQVGDVDFYGGSAQEPAQYRYVRNGSVVVIGGMDKATKIMSSEYDIVFVQEATELTETDWELLTTRLRNNAVSFQQLLADCNPDIPTHWLKQRANRGQTVLLNARHEDNPTLFHDDGQLTDSGAVYISKLDNLTGVRKERLRHGRWVAAEGLIYEDYDPTVHHKIIADPPHSWKRFWVVDFGYTNPFVLQCWAEDPDGRLYLYREIYHTKRLVEDHAKHILKIVRKLDGTWKEPKPTAIICDHDAEDRATLERHLGMGTVAAQKSVSDGIQVVQARLRIQKDGKPRIFFSPNALVERDQDLEDSKRPIRTIDELPGYIWDRTASSSVNKGLKETPLKKDDHGVDCVRYICAYRDLRSRPRVTWVRG